MTPAVTLVYDIYAPLCTTSNLANKYQVYRICQLVWPRE